MIFGFSLVAVLLSVMVFDQQTTGCSFSDISFCVFSEVVYNVSYCMTWMATWSLLQSQIYVPHVPVLYNPKDNGKLCVPSLCVIMQDPPQVQVIYLT